MSSLPTPNFVLTETVRIPVLKGWEAKDIPVGTFARPIDISYVPAHIIEAYKWTNLAVEVYCYTRYGMVPLPIAKLRKV